MVLTHLLMEGILWHFKHVWEAITKSSKEDYTYTFARDKFYNLGRSVYGLDALLRILGSVDWQATIFEVSQEFLSTAYLLVNVEYNIVHD